MLGRRRNGERLGEIITNLNSTADTASMPQKLEVRWRLVGTDPAKLPPTPFRDSHD
jgi:hypothetical protein